MSETIMRPVVGRDARGNTIRTTRIIRPHDWPRREEWAKQVRIWTRYFGEYDQVEVSNRVSDYMEAQEIAALIAALNARRSELGKELRAAKKQCPQAFRQKGETLTQWDRRSYARFICGEQQDIWTEPRSQLFRAIKAVKEDDRIPRLSFDGGRFPELDELQKRRQTAYDAEEQRIEDEYASRPIDDEAWTKELARRAEVERIDAMPDLEWFEWNERKYTHRC